MKKIIFKIFIIVILVIISAPLALASSMSLIPSKGVIDIGEQFYIDVILDPEGININGIEGNIIFTPENVSFIRAEYGKSVVNLWVEEPYLYENTISFAGIIPNGFSGVINPFNTGEKMPGFVTRLVFEGSRNGGATINALPSSLALNDGLGTIQTTLPSNIFIYVNNVNNPSIYKDKSNSTPELEAYVVRDPNLYNNQYTLIYNAIDRGQGIKKVMIKEGNRDWQEIKSPYLLKDQSRHSTITLQSYSFSGATVVMTIDPIIGQGSPVSRVIPLLIFFILLFIYIKKLYANKK